MTTDPVGLIREAAARLRAGYAMHTATYPLIADCLEGAARREEEFRAGLHSDEIDEGPDEGEEAALALALARAYLGDGEPS